MYVRYSAGIGSGSVSKNLIFLVDGSSSMDLGMITMGHHDKSPLAKAKKAISTMIDTLQPADRADIIVFYDSQVTRASSHYQYFIHMPVTMTK